MLLRKLLKLGFTKPKKSYGSSLDIYLTDGKFYYLIDDGMVMSNSWVVHVYTSNDYTQKVYEGVVRNIDDFKTLKTVLKINKKHISVVTNNDSTLHVFWYNDGDKPISDLVKICMKSWVLQGHNINVWTLGDTYDFGVEVEFTNLTDYCDDGEIPYEHLKSQLQPFSKTKRSVLGFVDWCRFKIMSLLDTCTIMDTDVVLLKNITHFNDTYVCEDSFHKGNRLNGLYPCAGIISTFDNKLGKYLLERSKTVMKDGMKHGTIQNLITDYVIEHIGVENFVVKPTTYYETQILGNNAFFELGYEELDLFEEELSTTIVRRLYPSYGIHCWNSLLNHKESFEKGTLLSVIKDMVDNDIKPSYESLKQYVIK